MISAPSEMRCSVTPMICITTKTMASTSGIEIETTRPARTPRLTKLTASTITTASTSAWVKPPTASSTMRGWSETRWMPTPIGSLALIRRIRAFRSSPKCSRLAFGRMAMARPIAGLPSTRNSAAGGSS